jgi:phosphoribosylamine--glycine ligase
MASEGYPVKYEKGYEITIPAEIADKVFVAGAALKDGKTVTSGGRVLGVTAIADTLKDAIDDSYAMVEQIHFDNAYWRHDIGKRAMEAE